MAKLPSLNSVLTSILKIGLSACFSGKYQGF